MTKYFLLGADNDGYDIWIERVFDTESEAKKALENWLNNQESDLQADGFSEDALETDIGENYASVYTGETLYYVSICKYDI